MMIGNGFTCGFCKSRDITETRPGKRECVECEAVAFNFGGGMFATEASRKVWEWYSSATRTDANRAFTANNSRFQKGSAVYTCRICDKRTRATGQSEEHAVLCANCFEECGNENEHLDTHDAPVDGCQYCDSSQSGANRAFTAEEES